MGANALQRAVISNGQAMGVLSISSEVFCVFECVFREYLKLGSPVGSMLSRGFGGGFGRGFGLGAMSERVG